MAINHKWKITRIDVWKELNGYQDIVNNIFYAIETSDSDYPDNLMTQNMALSVPFNPSSTIIPFSELTEEQVLEWVKAELKVYKRDETGMFILDTEGNRIEEQDLVPQILAEGERQLEELIHPKIVTIDFPWSN